VTNGDQLRTKWGDHQWPSHRCIIKVIFYIQKDQQIERIGYTHQIQAGDFTVVLDSLQELFQENPDAVTPKLLAARMEQKLQRHIHYTYATYLSSVLGFITMKGIGFGKRDTRYIVFDAELLAQKRAPNCEIPEKPNAMKKRGPVA